MIGVGSRGKICVVVHNINFPLGGGGGLPYKKDGDAHREISIEPLKGTNLAMAEAEFYT